MKKWYAILIGFISMISMHGIQGIIVQPVQALVEGITVGCIFYFGAKLFKKTRKEKVGKKTGVS